MEQLKITEGESGYFSDGVKLTDRDYELLEFALEMKFVSIDEVYQKFFKVKLNGHVSKSDCWARDRVLQLQNAGFLRPTRFYSERKSFYIATPKAYHLLRDQFAFRQFCYPTMSIDVRSFNHDWLVTKMRLEMERSNQIKRWWSEKHIVSGSNIFKGIPKKYTPDGLFENQQGEMWAFELEIALKAPKRYRDKVRFYSRLMSSGGASGSSPFAKCLFVCLKENVFESIKKQTLPYGSHFKVQMFPEFKRDLSLVGGSN